MKPKPNKKIDKLLGDLGLHPSQIDPEALTDEVAPKIPASHNPATGPCGKTCFDSEAAARKSAKRIMERGANTSFLRLYFCHECRAWHITSGKNVGPGHSTEPRRNAGRNRRNHHQSPPSDES